MGVQTEVEYTSAGVDPHLPQYTSVAVGSTILKYAHVDVGTTPRSEPMSLASSPQEPTTSKQTTTLETPQMPSLVSPAVLAPVAEHTATEVIVPYTPACSLLTDISVSATEPLTHGDEFYTI